MSYYETLLKKLDKLVVDEPLTALSLIEEELRMPYIEKEYEMKLNELYNQLQYLKQAPMKQLDIESALFNEETVFLAVEMLRKANIRQYLSVIETFLTTSDNETIKALLIALLIEQEIYQEIKLKKDGFDIVFVPNQIELPQENEDILEMQVELEQTLMKYPNIAQQCVELLYTKAYLNLPFSYSSSDKVAILSSIYKEILESYEEYTLLAELQKGLVLAN